MSCITCCLSTDNIGYFQTNSPQDQAPSSISEWIGQIWKSWSDIERNFEESTNIRHSFRSGFIITSFSYAEENSEVPLFAKNNSLRTFSIQNSLENRSERNIVGSLEDLMLDLKGTASNLNPNHPSALNRLLSVGDYYQKTNRFGKAIVYYRDVIDIYYSEFGKNCIEVSNVNVKIAKSYFLSGNFEQSIQEFCHALKIKIGILGDTDVDIGRIYEELSVVYSAKGEDRKALECLKNALSCYRASLGSHHIEVIHVLESIGSMYFCMESYLEAAKVIGEAVKLKKLKFDDMHQEVAESLLLWGICLIETEEKEKARQLIKESFRIVLLNHDEHSTEIPGALCKIGQLLYNSSQDETLGKEHLKALILRRKPSGSFKSKSADSLMYMGVIALHLKHFDEAKQFMLKAKSSYEKIFAKDHKRVNHASAYLGVIAKHQKGIQSACS